MTNGVMSDDPAVWFTFGPASETEKHVRELIENGASGVRLTFSYGTPDIHLERAELVTSVANSIGTSCTVVGDLEGEKPRVADTLETNRLSVEEGMTVQLRPKNIETDFDHQQIPIDSERLVRAIQPGDRILIGDGSSILKAGSIDGSIVNCTVHVAGEINPNRGVTIQGAEFEPQSFRQEDREDLKFIGSNNVFDAVAVSFVSGADDVETARDIIQECDHSPAVISKIETKQGVENAAEIAAASDAVMIARGDLALLLPWEELGINTRTLVSKIQPTDTPWIMATQIVEGIEKFAFPTRAEICDLTHWYSEGMDGVLLSYETAFGSHPTRAVSTTRKILDRCGDTVG